MMQVLGNFLKAALSKLLSIFKAKASQEEVAAEAKIEEETNKLK